MEPDIYIHIPHSWNDCPPCWKNFMGRLQTIPGWMEKPQSEVYMLMDAALRYYHAERVDWDKSHSELKFKDEKHKSYFILKWS